MTRNIRRFLSVEGASFLVAGLVHRGVLIEGYAHRQASIAETVIAAALLAGLALTWVWPARTRALGLAAQGFALAGTLAGVFTIAVGVGPRTAPDLVYHAGILLTLAWGILVAARVPVGPTMRRG